METASNAVDELGFPQLRSVNTLKSIAHLFGTSKSRCGIYLLEFPESVFYIGQSTDVVRRFGQHRKIHSDIIGFSFIPIKKANLNSKEKELIYKAENLNIVLSNSVHASNLIGDTDFDLVVGPQDQQQWLKNPYAINKADKSSKIELPDNHYIRFQKKFLDFSKRPNSSRIVNLLLNYTTACIPFPKRTEYSFWSISCMPSTNSHTYPRLACLNMGVMEMLVLGHQKGEQDKIWGFVNVASDELMKNWISIKRFKRAYPFVKLYDRNYRDGGQFQVSLKTEGLDHLEKMLSDERIQKSSAQLNLRVMRKRATIFNRYHCKQLADQIVE